MNLEKLDLLAESDPILEKIISGIPAPEVVSTHNVFHDLMSCVIEQQIHYRSTKGIFRKLLDKARLSELNPENFAHFEEHALQYVKLSMNKQETIIDILEFWSRNQVDWESLDEIEVKKELSSIKGIGKWTIDMILLYTLRRPDIFPVDDYHLKQIMVSLYGLDPQVGLKSRMIEISTTWQNHKSLAVLYLLAWKAHHRNRG